MTSTKVIINDEGRAITVFVCPKCGCDRFVLVSLGIPGTGTSKCLKCGYPVSCWAHEPKDRTIEKYMTR